MNENTRRQYESLIGFFLEETAKLEQQRIDRPTIFVTMVKVAWIIGLSAVINDGLKKFSKK